ncbi:MAG: KOW domain-containing RNA-binding protein [Clostridiales bacterium]|jgi:ribosomal protein L14E/L6E/L27E|nr:KOW domain-containing RNA-binding protein [Clostridiales bacterium]
MNKNTLSAGDAAVSLKGHDTGRIYLVVANVSDGFALVCDGEYRKIDNPKLKRISHLRFLQKEYDEQAMQTLKLKDADVKKTLKKHGR